MSVPSWPPSCRPVRVRDGYDFGAIICYPGDKLGIGRDRELAESKIIQLPDTTDTTVADAFTIDGDPHEWWVVIEPERRTLGLAHRRDTTVVSLRRLTPNLPDIVLVAGEAQEGPYGTVYADPVTVPCAVEGGLRDVHTDQTAAITATATIYAPASFADVLTVGSQVTMPDGREASVVAVTRHVGYVEAMTA